MVVYVLIVLAIAALFPRGVEGLWASLGRPPRADTPAAGPAKGTGPHAAR